MQLSSWVPPCCRRVWCVTGLLLATHLFLLSAEVGISAVYVRPSDLQDGSCSDIVMSRFLLRNPSLRTTGLSLDSSVHAIKLLIFCALWGRAIKVYESFISCDNISYKLQVLVYDVLSPTIVIIAYAIDIENIHKKRKDIYQLSEPGSNWILTPCQPQGVIIIRRGDSYQDGRVKLKLSRPLALSCPGQ